MIGSINSTGSVVQHRFSHDNEGQLLLLTGIVLTITILTLSIILLSVYNRQVVYNTTKISNIIYEFNTVKDQFGNSIEDKANQLYSGGERSRWSAVRDAYEETRDKYISMEQAARIMLDINLVESITTKDNTHFSIIVRMIMTDNTATLDEVVPYTVRINDEYFVVADHHAGPISVYDKFNEKDDTTWVYNGYQDVPYQKDGEFVVRTRSTGHSYAGNFYRTSYQPAPFAVRLDFMVESGTCNAHFSLETTSSPTYHRWGVIVGSNNIHVQYNTGTGWVYPKTLIDPVKTGTWYTLTLVANDVSGFYISVQEKYNPEVCNNYTLAMPAGLQWRFHHWSYENHYIYIDNYIEHGVDSSRTTLYVIPFFGSNSFGTPQMLETSFPQDTLTCVADMTSDGIPDIVCAQGGNIYLLEKSREGYKFTDRGIIGNYNAVNGTRSITVADFNRDGNMDIAVANNGSYPAGEIWFLFGDGKGSLPYISRITRLDRPDNLHTDDIDFDGYPEIIYQNATSGILVYNTNYGNGTFDREAKTYLVTDCTVLESTALADPNGDSHLDLVYRGPDGYTYIWFGHGMASFDENPRYSGYANPDFVYYAPYMLTSAGFTDLIVVRPHDWISVWLNTGTAYYTTEEYIGRIAYSTLSYPSVPPMPTAG